MPDDLFHVSVICSGNICRSPIGEHVLRAALERAGLGDRVRVSSAGIGAWHVGQQANPPAAEVLRSSGYTFDHVARQITPAEVAAIDLLLAADRTHFRDLRAMAGPGAGDKVRMLRSFDPTATDDDVPDPYGRSRSAFTKVLEMTEAATPGIVEEIRRRLVAQQNPAENPGSQAVPQ